jgi:hypothetical protein
MEIPVPSLETIKVAWDWSLKQLQLWFEVLRNPSEVLKTIDLDSTDSLIAALKFAIFPTCLTSFVELPAYLLTKDASLGFIGYFIVSLVTSPLQIFIFSVSQRVSAKIWLGRGSLNASTIATLYATAFGPLWELGNLFALNHIELRERDAGFTPAWFANFLLVLVLFIYLTFKFVPMTRVVHKVGRFRATMICWLTMFIGALISLLLVQPLHDKTFGLA